jgi:hypothetical protein
MKIQLISLLEGRHITSTTQTVTSCIRVPNLGSRSNVTYPAIISYIHLPYIPQPQIYLADTSTAINTYICTVNSDIMMYTKQIVTGICFGAKTGSVSLCRRPSRSFQFVVLRVSNSFLFDVMNSEPAFVGQSFRWCKLINSSIFDANDTLFLLNQFIHFRCD